MIYSKKLVFTLVQLSEVVKNALSEINMESLQTTEKILYKTRKGVEHFC